MIGGDLVVISACMAPARFNLLVSCCSWSSRCLFSLVRGTDSNYGLSGSLFWIPVSGGGVDLGLVEVSLLVWWGSAVCSASSVCVGFSDVLSGGGVMTPNGGSYLSGSVVDQSAVSSRKNRRSLSS